jgi:hypothetical protein
MDVGGSDFVYKFSEKTGNIGYGPEFRGLRMQTGEAPE